MRIDDNEGVSASSKHLVFAYYVTGHGFGHATRIVEVVRHLIAAGHDVHVVIGAPDFVFTSEIQSPRLKIRKVLLDCGAVQADALTVDRLASLEKYVETAVIPRAEILETEVEWLHSIKADFVVSDVVPVACRAAADAGIRSVCVTNFSSVGSICSQEKPYALKSGPFDLLQTELLYWDVLRVAPISISFLNPKTECSNYYHVLLL